MIPVHERRFAHSVCLIMAKYVACCRRCCCRCCSYYHFARREEKKDDVDEMEKVVKLCVCVCVCVCANIHMSSGNQKCACNMGIYNPKATHPESPNMISFSMCFFADVPGRGCDATDDVGRDRLLFTADRSVYEPPPSPLLLLLYGLLE